MITRDYSDKDLRAALGSSPPLEKMKMTKEHCTDCDAETGRAGRGEDSLYAGDFGPYCEGCWDELRETLAESLRKAHAEIKSLKTAVNSHASNLALITELADLIKRLLEVWDPEWEPGKSLRAEAIQLLERTAK